MKSNKQNLFTFFAKDNSGLIAVTFALMLGVFVAMARLLFDGGGAMLDRTALSSAADAGALSAAISEGDESQVLKYFYANMMDGQYASAFDDSNIDIEIGNAHVTVTPNNVRSTAYFSTQTYVNVSTISQVAQHNSAYAPGDYYLTLDESGSMGGSSESPLDGSITSKNIALRQSVQMMLDIVFGEVGTPEANTPSEDYKMGMVSYTTSTTDKTNPINIRSTLDNVLPAHTQTLGTTCCACGLKDTYKMFKQHSNNDDRKIIIFMTDGICNKTVSNGSGEPSDELTTASTPITQAKEWCDKIKNKPNTEIWTIGFGSPTSISTDALEYCASEPDMFIVAESGMDLGDAFTLIGNTTTKVRITK